MLHLTAREPVAIHLPTTRARVAPPSKTSSSQQSDKQRPKPRVIPRRRLALKQQGRKGKAKPQAKASANATSSSAQAHTAELLWAHAVMDDNDMSATDATFLQPLLLAHLLLGLTQHALFTLHLLLHFTPLSLQARMACYHQSWIQEPLTASFPCNGSPMSNRFHQRRFRWQVELLSELYFTQNVIYCATVTLLPDLISVSQLKTVLDLRMVWDDSSQSIHACSGGLRYILIEASIYHNLLVITHHGMQVLLQDIGDFARHGTLYNAAIRSWSGS